MCGIVGVVSAHTNGLSVKESDAFRDMLFVDTLRGVDSTGAFGVCNNNDVIVHKEATHGLRFLARKEMVDFSSTMIRRGKFVVGHNRAATRGTIKDENAHPFVVDNNIILVQNGTYRGCHKHHKDVEVDTEALAHVIAEEPDVEKALQKINAAYALVWYNVKEKRLHMVRNHERPLCIAYTKAGGMLFASEIATIAYVALRHDIELKDPPYLVAADQLLTFDLGDDGEHTHTFKEVDNRYRHTPVKVQPATANDDDSYYGNMYGFHLGEHGLSCGYTPTRTYPKTVYGRNDNTVNFIESCLTDYNYYQYWIMGEQDVQKEKAALKPFEGKKCLIEIQDYVPLNSDKDCTTFALYGSILDPNYKGSTLVYTTLRNTTEDEMIKLSLERAVYAQLTNPIERRFSMDSNSYTMLTMYATEIEALPVLVNNETTH